VGYFEELHADRIVGTLTMFDRMIFKGHLTRLFAPGAISALLWKQGYPLKEFTAYAQATTEQITDNAKRLAADAGRPYIYLDHARTRAGAQKKEDLARAIAARDGVAEGVVCVISVVEPCWSFQVRKSQATHRLEATRRERKCVHHYLYLIDPEFGFMHVRVQAWMPYEIQIYINGREWLARQLDRAGIGYRRHDNALLWVEDLERAQKLCERFAHRAWPRVLNAFARRINPLLSSIGRAGFGGYYWVLDQAEVATDVLFRTRPELLAVWPDLVRHAAANLSAEDVLRFLGRKLHPSLKAEVLTEAKRRPEGWRLKHRMARNWVKAYDKASVLRVETTINNPREFRVLRVVSDDGDRRRRWCEMRKGVANTWRYFQVGASSNRRYLDALAAATPHSEGAAVLDALCRPRTNHGRHAARFNPLDRADLALFRAVLAGEHAIVGFRNHDIANRLYRRPPADAEEAHRVRGPLPPPGAGLAHTDDVAHDRADAPQPRPGRRTVLGRRRSVDRAGRHGRCYGPRRGCCDGGERGGGGRRPAHESRSCGCGPEQRCVAAARGRGRWLTSRLRPTASALTRRGASSRGSASPRSPRSLPVVWSPSSPCALVPMAPASAHAWSSLLRRRRSRSSRSAGATSTSGRPRSCDGSAAVAGASSPLPPGQARSTGPEVPPPLRPRSPAFAFWRCARRLGTRSEWPRTTAPAPTPPSSQCEAVPSRCWTVPTRSAACPAGRMSSAAGLVTARRSTACSGWNAPCRRTATPWSGTWRRPAPCRPRPTRSGPTSTSSTQLRPLTQRHEMFVAISVAAARASRVMRASGGGDEGACEVLLREARHLETRLGAADVGVEGLLDTQKGLVRATGCGCR